MKLMGLENFKLFDKENEEKVLRNWTTPLQPFDDLTWLTVPDDNKIYDDETLETLEPFANVFKDGKQLTTPNNSKIWTPLEPVENSLNDRECITEMSDLVAKKIYENIFLHILEDED